MVSGDVPGAPDYASRFQLENAAIIAAIRRKLEEIKPAVVLNFKTGKFGDLHFANRGLDLPVVASIRTDPRVVFTVSPEFPPERRQLFDECMTSSAVITVLHDEFATFFEPTLRDKVCVTPIQVPRPRGSPASPRSRQIVCVARISSEKNPILLVEAFARLIPAHPDWVLKWVGGDYYGLGKEVRARIDALGAREHIILAGESSDVESHLKASSIFAFPSSFEGWGNAATEAMAAGLPVVALESCASLRFFIRSFKCGLLSAPTREDFACKLETLMNHEDLRARMGEDARRIAEVFTSERTMAAWEAVLARVSIGKPSRILLFYEKFHGFLGGIERSMTNLANGLVARGHTVELLLTQPRPAQAVAPPYPLDPSVRIHHLHS